MVIVDVQEAARQLGVSPRRVRKILADKLVPGVRIGRAWAVEQRHLDRFKINEPPTARPGVPRRRGGASGGLSIASRRGLNAKTSTDPLRYCVALRASRI